MQLTTIRTSDLVSQYRPGSYGDNWTWENECRELNDDPATSSIERRCLTEGWGFADNTHPVILGYDGRVWDGHHRICLALRHGVPTLRVFVVPT